MREWNYTISKNQSSLPPRKFFRKFVAVQGEVYDTGHRRSLTTYWIAMPECAFI
jgi:hypothetical protein